jgi:flagellar biosynthesis/type III secretory pathway M-ring protein FliF/YscJ
MLTESQKDSIEDKISEWKDAAFPASYTWIYILVGALIIFIVIPFVIKKRKLNKVKNQKVDEKKDNPEV